MARLKILKNSLLLLLVGFCLTPIASQAASYSRLSLTQAEQIALRQAPEIKSLQAKSQALNQSSIAVGQLTDPKLILGTMNMPVNSFDVSQEPMTQAPVIGIEQTFPRGHSLRYRSLKQRDQSHAELEKAKTMRAQILLNVRVAWLNLYFWLCAKHIVLSKVSIFRHLIKVTESMLANNKAQQKDVIRAQLELTDLDNQLIEINQHIDTARAELARWIGNSLAKQANPRRLPHWSNPPKLVNLNVQIKHHPILRTDQAMIAANRATIQLAEQQYKPGIAVGVAYGFRYGHDTVTNQRRSDFLTAEVSMDLPFFTHNRQDRTLKASEAYLTASIDDRMSHYRQLRETLKTQYITWQQQGKSAWLYRAQLIPEAKQYAESTLIAYQNHQTDFPTLARAYVREMSIQHAGVKASVNCAIARANLLYLEGK